MEIYETVGGKCCPLCERADMVVIETRAFFDELVRENGVTVLTIECKRCHLLINDYDDGKTGNYDVVRHNLIEKWDGLPRWKRVRLKLA